MSYKAKDGAWVSTANVTQVRCSKCGVVRTIPHTLSEREAFAETSKHVAEKHSSG